MIGMQDFLHSAESIAHGVKFFTLCSMPHALCNIQNGFAKISSVNASNPRRSREVTVLPGPNTPCTS